jgi:hypothetical protein
MDLVRTILMRIENNSPGWTPADPGIFGYMRDQIDYHTHIMFQEGLIEGSDGSMNGTSAAAGKPILLTWKGHEFLDLARDQDRWNRAKTIIAKVGGAPIAVWMKVLNDLVIKGVETASTTTA